MHKIRYKFFKSISFILTNNYFLPPCPSIPRSVSNCSQVWSKMIPGAQKNSHIEDWAVSQNKKKPLHIICQTFTSIL